MLMTYQHVYSHQDDPQKVLKIHQNIITMAEATALAKKSSPAPLLYVAWDRAARAGRERTQNMPVHNPGFTVKVEVVLDMGVVYSFRNMMEIIYWVAHRK